MSRSLLAASLLALSSCAMAQRVECPNLPQVVDDTGYPMAALALGLGDGKALVEFTLLPDGSVVEPTVLESTHHAFGEQALTIAKRLVCLPTNAERRVRLPVNFVLPKEAEARAPARNRCTPADGFAEQAAYPREAANLGLTKGSALVVVHVLSDGTKTYKVDKATHPAFAAAAMRAVTHMSCVNPDGEVDIRVPFEFQLAP